MGGDMYRRLANRLEGAGAKVGEGKKRL